MRAGALAVLALLAGCSRHAAAPAPAAGESDLERAAIAAGIVEDPASIDLTGLYARDTDRLCVVPAKYGFAIGAFVDYGDNQSCSGTGTVTRVGDSLHVEFDAAPGCSFEARYDADRIAFPGRVPDACDKLCNRRASIAALEVERLSGTVAEASTLRDDKGKLLCGN